MHVPQEPRRVVSSNGCIGTFSERGAKTPFQPSERGGSSGGKWETDKQQVLSNIAKRNLRELSGAGAASALPHLIHAATLWVSIPFTMRKPRLRDVKEFALGPTVINGSSVRF